jgi:hypothetical protein
MKGERTYIKLYKGAPVKINCPAGTEQKHPAFYKAFHGRRCKVLDVEPKGAANVVQCDITQPQEPQRWINVHIDWLSHDRKNNVKRASLRRRAAA